MTHSLQGPLHSAFQRLAMVFVLAIPVALVGDPWAAREVRPAPPHVARTVSTSPLASLATGEASDERSESAVVLVVLDGVRWQEIFDGVDRAMARQHGMGPASVATARDLMPNLHRLIDAGVALGAPGHGAEIAASGPQFISLPGYIEIFDGKPDLGCSNNDCVPSPTRTLADQVEDASGADDVAVVTSWPNIARAASSSPGFALTAGRTRVAREEALRADPAVAELVDKGAGAGAFPGDGDYRPDAFTIPIALRELESARPRFLFVGLGDADEYAHRNDYRRYLEALRAADAFLGGLTTTLRSMGARGRHTTVIVTADHGRAYNFMDHGPASPESGRVWLVASGDEVRGRGLVASPRRHTLSDVAPTIRTLLGLHEASEGRETPIGEIVAGAGVSAGSFAGASANGNANAFNGTGPGVVAGAGVVAGRARRLGLATGGQGGVWGVGPGEP